MRHTRERDLKAGTLSRRELLRVSAPALIGLSLSGCGSKSSSPTSPSSTTTPTPPTPTPFTIKGGLTETFSGQALGGIEVAIEGAGKRFTGTTTPGGEYQITVDTAGTYTLKFNTNQGNTSVVPAIIENKTLGGDQRIDLDLPSVAKLFENYDHNLVIEAYRGFPGFGAFVPPFPFGTNVRWTKQPSKWLVYDANGALTAQADWKSSSTMDAIMSALAYVQKYTSDFITIPGRDAFELRIGNPGTQYESGSFSVIHGNSLLSEHEQLSGNEISGCVSSAPDAVRYFDQFAGECVSSVQGGDSQARSGIYLSIFDRVSRARDIDYRWGLFNYYKRKPGEKILPAEPAARNSLGYTVEYRLI